MKRSLTAIGLAALLASPMLQGPPVMASSHMDAPQITFDDPANTTDVYAFVSEVEGEPYLTTALGVYPFEAPGIGANNFSFDPNVLYEIHVSLGDDLEEGRKTLTYKFRFDRKFQNQNTILQSFLGTLEGNKDDKGFDINQNLRQEYSVRLVDRRIDDAENIGNCIVPPNNQGLVTPFYNQDNNGENPAKGGVQSEDDLDIYTKHAICDLEDGHRVFAGQRDDGFYADIQSIFDLDLTFAGPNKPFDSQGGFNIHTIVLQIPISFLEGDQQVVGVHAQTKRRAETIIPQNSQKDIETNGKFEEVGRQGNPLFNEAFVAIVDKDLYSRTKPAQDKKFFEDYALNPELAAVLQPLLGLPDNLLTNRTDLAAIFIPDVIKEDLSTGPARLVDNDDEGFNRLSIFGGDTLISQVQEGFGGGVVPGGWPNGRRFGDDVVDIAVLAAASDLRVSPPIIFGAPNTADVNIDGVVQNDITFNAVMPYAATPLNGRNHLHR